MMISSSHNDFFGSTCVHSGSGGADCIFAHCSFPFKPSFQVTKEAVLESWPMSRGESLSRKHCSSLQRLWEMVSNEVHRRVRAHVYTLVYHD